MATTTTIETVGELGQRFSGAVLTPETPGYDEMRRVHNGLVDKRPAVIARCLNTADVVDAVTLGHERGSNSRSVVAATTSPAGRSPMAD
jgi:hypothetical protein